MATAKKLPSGSWRCQVYDYADENGKRHYKSFTSTDQSAKGKRAGLSEFDKMKIENITPELIQEFINRKAQEKSPKTVKNIHGIIFAVLKVYRPEMALNTTLPQKVPPKLYIPTDEDVKTLLGHIDNEIRCRKPLCPLP